MADHYYAVIMAGGGGTRLWPLSRQNRPKQMLSLFDERSLFQTTVHRLDGLFEPPNILVVTVQEQAQDLQAQTPEIPPENFLIEPAPRGTAPVVGLAAVALRHRDPESIMAILPSDHFIGNEQHFRHLLEAACDVASDGGLVTLGIEPTYAATGYGYIQQGEWMGNYRNMDVYQVLRFKEKPDEEQARQMLSHGGHSWNSGMFVWQVDQILAEFHQQMPELSAGLELISSAWGTKEQQPVLDRIWHSLRPETIDYGIMENARRVVVIPARELNWSDVGSWDSIFNVVPGDRDGNIVMGGEHVGIDTKKSLVFVRQEHRLIVTIGVEDLVVVDTGDVLLVCRKDQAQKVRQVVEKLKREGQEYI
jgi:mannose-1-phosphate guanylyltransferase